MKKIRIGNDIRLAVDLRKQLTNSAQEGEEVNDSINVRQVSAYLINTTKLAEYKQKAKNRSNFIGRFPREPFSHDYQTTAWCLCGCGKPTWNAYPTNAGEVYSGFGTQPYKGLAELKKLSKSIQYNAKCSATNQQSVILVDFPAEDQLYKGVYTLILVAKIYAPGYNQHNLKTYTFDMPNVFELVASLAETVEQPSQEEPTQEEPAVNTDVTIGVDIDNTDYSQPADPEIPDIVYQDIYVESGTVSNGNLSLGRTDGNPVTVDLGGIVGWFDADIEED